MDNIVSLEHPCNGCIFLEPHPTSPNNYALCKAPVVMPRHVANRALEQSQSLIHIHCAPDIWRSSKGLNWIEYKEKTGVDISWLWEGVCQLKKEL